MVLWDESGQELTALPAVIRLHLEGLERIAAQDFWLLAGELGPTARKRVLEGNPTESLLDQRLPLSVWSEGRQLVLAPTQVLEPGPYSVAALGFGLVAQLEVLEEERAVFHRFGPSVVEAGEAVAYCPGLPPLFERTKMDEQAEAGAMESSQELPPGVQRGLGPSEWGAPCVRVVVPDVERGFFVPPQSLGEALLDPSIFSLTGDSPPLLSASDGSEKDTTLAGQAFCFDHGCVVLSEVALAFDFESGSYAVELTDAHGPQFFVMQATEGRPFFRGPLVPNSGHTVKVRELQGLHQEFEFAFHSGDPAPRFVVTEVMANPRGPEPEGEWVEILNVGTAAGSLDGFLLSDESGDSRLGDVTLEPGQYGLVVSPGYVPVDNQTPHPDSVPVVVEKIGENGVRNSGEVVSLKDPSGAVISVVPAWESPEGISVARLHPWAPDDASSFARHGATGASPGADNDLTPLD